MNPWPFIIAAYLIAIVATLALAGFSFAQMRRLEGQADSLRRRP